MWSTPREEKSLLNEPQWLACQSLFQDDLPRVVETFADEFVATLGDLTPTSSNDEWQHWSHRMRGSAHNLGFQSLGQILTAIEIQAKNHTPPRHSTWSRQLLLCLYQTRSQIRYLTLA
jgi:HPt (histidine-containing phosphotransfer) domain-containing protein